MKLYATVKKFSEESPKLFTAFKAYFENTQLERQKNTRAFADVSKSDQEQVINKLFAEELTRKTGTMSEELDMAHFATNVVVKSFADAIIDNMVDMILPDTLITSLSPFVDFKFAGLGDVLKFDIKNNSLFKVSKSGRRQRTTPAQKQGIVSETVVTENHQVTVYLSLFDVLTGRQSIAEYIMKVIRSIETEMLYEAYDALISATSDANIPSDLKETAYDEEKLISLCQKVTAWNGGSKAIIMGTAVALKSVLPANANGRILLGDEYNTIGYMSKFNNYDVICMEQVADWTSDNYGLKLNDNKIFVISPATDKLIKCGVEGGAMSYTSPVQGNANLVQEGSINKAWGIMACTNAVAGRMDV